MEATETLMPKQEDGYPCDACGEFVPEGEECGSTEAGLEEWKCPDCYGASL